MKTLKLINPVIKSDVIDDTFTGENTMEVAKSAFKLLAKYMVTTKSNRFIYSLKDVNSNQEYHFDGQKNVVKKGKASLKIKKINIDKTGGGSQKIHLKNMVGSGKKKLDLSSSNISDDLLKELSVDSSESDMSNESDDSEQSSSSDIYGGHSEGKKKRRKRRRKKKSLARAKRKSKRRSSSKSDEKDSETYEEWLRRRYLFPANTYFFYDPLYYYLPDYTSYIFDRNVFIPNLYYSLYPYSQTVWPWI